MNRAYFFATLCISLIDLMIALKPDLRVMGGRDATPGEYPFAVRLESHVKFIFTDKNITMKPFGGCSGAALSASWTLSARHCLPRTPHSLKNMTYFIQETRAMVRYGDPHKKPSENDKLSAILMTTVRNKGLNVDIGLLFTEPLILTKYAKVSALDYKTLFGQPVTVVGFGLMRVTPTAHDSDFTLRLDKPLQIMDKAMLISCGINVGADAVNLCVVPACGEVQSAYFGDSGGPVVHETGIVGVNSMSNDTFFMNDYPSMRRVAKPNILGVTPVSPNIDWIYLEMHKDHTN